MRPGHATTEPAELVLTGGIVHPFDAAVPGGSRGSDASALAVRDGVIVAVGTDRDVDPLIGPATRVLALAGRTAIPGINDSHLHATWLGATWPRTLFGGSGGLGGGGGGQAGGDSGQAGGDSGQAGGDSGQAGGSPPGTPELPVRLVSGAGQRRAAITRAGQVCAELGITSYTEAGLGPGEDDGDTGCFGQEVLADYVALADAGQLSARVTALRLFGRLDGPSTLADVTAGLATPPPTARDSRWFAVTGVKIFADGIPPMGSAWTRHRYRGGGNGGLLVDGRDPAERAANLHAMITRTMAAGAQVGVHATGDLSIDAVIDAFAAGPCRTELPNYIVHGDLITGAALQRMARLGIGLTVQPGIATATREMMALALGAEVTATAWPLAAMLVSGVPLTLSSDAPVLAPDWRAHIADAARLLGRDGTHPGLMARLLRCYTTAAAAQDGAAHWKGTLAPGMAADLCVLDGDPLHTRLAEVPGLRVQATIAGGRLTHDKIG